MKPQLELTPPPHNGFRIEHIMLSVTVVHTNEIMQYDDSCAYLIGKGLKEYNGVVSVQAETLYKHGKMDTHPEGCDCGHCTYHTRMAAIRVDPFTGCPVA
jgi:hypothetical protein